MAGSLSQMSSPHRQEALRRVPAAAAAIAFLAASVAAPRAATGAAATRLYAYATVHSVAKNGKYLNLQFILAGKGIPDAVKAKLKDRRVPTILAPKAGIIRDTFGKTDALTPDRYAIVLGKRLSWPEPPKTITPDDVLRGLLGKLKKGRFRADLIVVGPVGLPGGYDAKRARPDDLMQVKVRSNDKQIEVVDAQDEAKPYVLEIGEETKVLVTSQVQWSYVKPKAPLYVTGTLRPKNPKNEAYIPGSTVFAADKLRLVQSKSLNDPRYRKLVEFYVGF